MSPKRFEPPIVRPLYVTLTRASELLDVPYWKMHGLSFCLETRYFGEKGGAPRVLLSSIDEYIELRDSGQDAQAILSGRRGFTGWSPYPSQVVRTQLPEQPNYWQRRRRRRWA